MNILITGATSGIGRELAIQLAKKGYKVGLIGRRAERLAQIKEQLGSLAFTRCVDITQHELAETAYRELIAEMGGLDVMILNAGVGNNRTLEAWPSDKNIIDVNILAFAHGCHFAFNFFSRQGHGHIVGISSLTAFVASHFAAAYCASKHFVRSYLTAYRQKARRVSADITVTDICPGFVKSELIPDSKYVFWNAETDKAVRQMIKAIEKKKNHAYITKRWRLMAWLAKSVPQFVWDRL